jgi:hypothetical protein
MQKTCADMMLGHWRLTTMPERLAMGVPDTYTLLGAGILNAFFLEIFEFLRRALCE